MSKRTGREPGWPWVYEEFINGFYVKLSVDGKFFIGTAKQSLVQRDWYKNPSSRQPWIPRRMNFINLVKESIKSGTYDDLMEVAST